MNSGKSVAFIGVGSMGWPMAQQLVEAEFNVSVVDANESQARRFAREVGGAVREAGQAISQSSIVISMLPNSALVEQVISSNLASFVAGQLFIDMSSGDPHVTRRLGEQLISMGVSMIDAPVSGGRERASRGDLALMLGGTERDIERAEPILEVIGSSMHHCGELGSGQAMKALNNMVSAAGFLIGIEALIIGKRFGLDPGTMVDVLNASSGMNNSTQKRFKQHVLSGTFDSGFDISLMSKDVGIALSLARTSKLAVPLASQCEQLWIAAVQLLGTGHDWTEVVKLSELLSGVAISGEGDLDV